jgi:hypothetical protein
MICVPRDINGASGAYRSLAYFVSWGVVETPFVVVSGGIFCFVIYWCVVEVYTLYTLIYVILKENYCICVSYVLPLRLVGFQTSQFGFFLLSVLTFQLFSVTYGQAIAVWSPSAMVAMMVRLALSL